MFTRESEYDGHASCVESISKSDDQNSNTNNNNNNNNRNNNKDDDGNKNVSFVSSRASHGSFDMRNNAADMEFSAMMPFYSDYLVSCL